MSELNELKNEAIIERLEELIFLKKGITHCLKLLCVLKDLDHKQKYKEKIISLANDIELLNSSIHYHYDRLHEWEKENPENIPIDEMLQMVDDGEKIGRMIYATGTWAVKRIEIFQFKLKLLKWLSLGLCR